MNKGDDVKCTNNFGTWTLSHGHVYRVLDARDNTIQVQGKHGGTNWYRKNRFIKVREGQHMGQVQQVQKVKVGDKVVRLSGTGLRVGAEYTVISVRSDSQAVRLAGEGGSWWCMSTLSVVESVPPQPDVLTDDQVFAYLAQGVPLEYFFDKTWHEIANPKGVSIQFIQTTQFRKKRELIEVSGTLVPKPTIRNFIGYSEEGVAYSISFNKQEVFKAPIKQLSGKPYWLDPKDAHAALIAVLKPFKLAPKRLNPNYEAI